MRLRKVVWSSSLLVLLLGATAAAQATDTLWDTYSDTWVGEDALGHALATNKDVGPPRPNKQTGIFYYLWLGSNYGNGPYDNTRILAQDPDALNHPAGPDGPGDRQVHGGRMTRPRRRGQAT